LKLATIPLLKPSIIHHLKANDDQEEEYEYTSMPSFAQ
jgi:hypothetical protein